VESRWKWQGRAKKSLVVQGKRDIKDLPQRQLASASELLWFSQRHYGKGGLCGEPHLTQAVEREPLTIFFPFTSNLFQNPNFWLLLNARRHRSKSMEAHDRDITAAAHKDDDQIGTMWKFWEKRDSPCEFSRRFPQLWLMWITLRKKDSLCEFYKRFPEFWLMWKFWGKRNSLYEFYSQFPQLWLMWLKPISKKGISHNFGFEYCGSIVTYTKKMTQLNLLIFDIVLAL